MDLQHGTIITDDAMDALTALPENSVHAVVTDPPYGLAFMGESWDDFDPVEYQSWCQEWAQAVKQPLKPGGHVLAFSGNRTHHRLMVALEDAGYEIRDTVTWHYGEGMPKAAPLSTWLSGEGEDQWGDWRGTVKPATEFVALARSPLGEGSATQNQVEHGTANLNVEACRLGDGDGRYPANVALDPPMADLIDAQSGVTESTGGQEVRGFGSTEKYGDGDDRRYKRDPGYGDVGGASRFFYTAKSSPADRTHDGEVENDHPTVKPTDLMEWLVKLVTDDGQWVLDPFAGSGTTLVAAENAGRKAVGIEKESEYVNIAERRIEAAKTEETA